MTTISRTEDLNVLQLAKSQVEEFNVLLSTTSFINDAELKHLLETSVKAVVNSMEEGFHPLRSEEFRKNFLVIAKGFNGEVRALLHQCMEKEHISLQRHNELHQKNKALEDSIISLIKQLRHTANKE